MSFKVGYNAGQVTRRGVVCQKSNTSLCKSLTRNVFLKYWLFSGVFVFPVTPLDQKPTPQSFLDTINNVKQRSHKGNPWIWSQDDTSIFPLIPLYMGYLYLYTYKRLPIWYFGKTNILPSFFSKVFVTTHSYKESGHS